MSNHERGASMATPVKPMSSRAVQAERTRQQILATAQRLFAERRYDATSLPMIAPETGAERLAFSTVSSLPECMPDLVDLSDSELLDALRTTAVHILRVPSGPREYPGRSACRSGLQEGQQVSVDRLGLGGRHTDALP